MTERTRTNDYLLSLHTELTSHGLRVLHLNSHLQQENKDLKSHVNRLRILLSDAPEFHQEKRTMLEALHQSRAREREEKKRLREEEKENDSLEDALADLQYLRSSVKSKQLQITTLKRAVFRAKCAEEEVQDALALRDEALRRRHLEMIELYDLYENCVAHAKETAARIKVAQDAARGRERSRMRPSKAACTTKWTKTAKPPAKIVEVCAEERPSRAKDMLVTVCSFALTLLFLFFFISFILPTFSLGDRPDISCTELLLDSVKELVVPFVSHHHHHTPPPF